MNDTRKRLIAALQELLDKCTSKLPYASEKEEDYLRGRYSAIIDMADKIKEICTDKPQAMINKNDVLVFQCIMALNKCDMESAIKFAGHNQTCYKIAMAVAQAKDEQLKAEKQALIDKACEWWESELTYPTMTQAEIDDFVLGRIKEFKQAMKGE